MAEGDYVGRYGETLRRITNQQAQQGAFAGPGVVGGADAPGATPIRMAQTRSTRDMITEPAPQAAPAQGGMGGMDPSAMMGMMGSMGGGGGNSGMMSGGAGFTDGASAGGMMYAAEGGDLLDGDTMVGERGPEVVRKQGNSAFVIPNHNLPAGVISEAGAMGGAPSAGAMTAQKPTSWQDLAAEMPKAQQNNLVKQIEAKHGPIKAVYAAATTREGDEPRAKNKREMALYLAEVALRTISNMGTGRYRGNSAAAFSDAMLDTEARRGAVSAAEKAKAEKVAETARLEGRADAETRRKEGREDAEAKRKREQELEDDARNHKQAIELARIQAKLLREQNKKTSIQTDSDGTLVLVDEDGNAIDITKEVEVTETKGSRGQGTSTTTKKVRKPVKASPKYNASGLDQDTLVNRVSDAEKAMRDDRKLMRELNTKFNNDRVKVEAELRRMAREKVEGDVQSLGAGGSGTIDFNELK